jgi:hypothetical protein
LLAFTFLTSTALLCVMVLLNVVFAQSSNRNRVVNKLTQAGEPIEITKLKVKGKPLNFNREFSDDDDWVKGLTVEVKNVSGREIIYLQIELDFPVDDSDARVFVVSLEYGYPPEEGDVAPVTKPLQPVEVVTLSATSGVADALKREIREKGSGNALKMNKADIYVNQVWFDMNTVWGMGTIFERDPTDKKKWNPIKTNPDLSVKVTRKYPKAPNLTL